MPPESAGVIERAVSNLAGDPFVRRKGRALIIAMHAALRAIRLYPLENETVRRTVEDVAALAGEILRQEHEMEMRASSEFIFVNSTRLRLDLDNYASFGQVLTLLRGCGVGVLRVHAAASARDWLVLLARLHGTTRGEPDDRRAEIAAALEEARIAAFELGPPTDRVEEDEDFQEHAKEAAKRTYVQSVAVTKEVINSARLGRSVNVKKIKRVVQGIVDQVLNEETSLLGLTTLRDYDEYTFTHSVNVCIFSVALGRRLGLTKLQLYDLGLAALFHDIGKSRVPLHVLNKAGALTEEEWRLITDHPWLGVLSLFQMRGHQELPYRAMIVAYEHHMKRDLTGYPKNVRPRAQGIFSKIVAVADGFDAATSRRAYQSDPMNPAEVLAGMRDNPRRGFDPVVVKAFINLLGIYPVGTLVVLDSYELALVHAPNPNPELLSRPLVRIVSDGRGNLLYPGTVVDLAERRADGGFARTIIKTDDAARYGINVGDYFV